MEHDYYAVLGVSPDADPEVIRKAFLAEARRAHPDRGGSHERMVLVNEAWEILSNPEMRRAYDEHRGHVRSEQPDDFEETRRTAHRKATDYPRDWTTFEKWLNGLAEDFKGAKFHSREAMNMSWPNAKDSLSGWLFIIVGGISGLYIADYLLPLPKATGKVSPLHLMFAAIPVCIGAWGGAAAHMALGYVLRELPNWMGAIDEIKRPELKTAVVVCTECGQKLRVPVLDDELIVTCTKCRCRFKYPNV